MFFFVRSLIIFLYLLLVIFSHRDSATSPTSTLGDIVTKLLTSSLQPSSIPTYKRAWAWYIQFLTSVSQQATFHLPIDPATLALYSAYLYSKGYTPSTVHTYIMAIGYSHKLFSFHDPSRIFYIAKIMKGYRKIGSRLDSWLPVTLPILHRLLEVAPDVLSSPYQVCLFQAMCCLAFFAFLRIGEMTASGRTPMLHLRQLTKLVNSANKVVTFKLSFSSFKHSYNPNPFSLEIHQQSTWCPVQILTHYCNLLGPQSGALFLAIDSSAVSRKPSTDQLSLAVLLWFGSHSL